jgi:NAD+ kinase
VEEIIADPVVLVRGLEPSAPSAVPLPVDLYGPARRNSLGINLADGLVVASPTGSTGYSFSAGGPILDPGSRNLIVTPIAAYLSAIRSVVVGPSQVVRCTVVDAFEALVSVDGREDLPLAVGDVVEVRALERPSTQCKVLIEFP